MIGRFHVLNRGVHFACDMSRSLVLEQNTIRIGWYSSTLFVVLIRVYQVFIGWLKINIGFFESWMHFR